MIYWATAKLNYQASVMITASHNPANHNGLKISRAGALPVGFDTGLSDLLEMAETQMTEPVSIPGKYSTINFRKEYLEFLAQYQSDLSGLKLQLTVQTEWGHC